MMQVKEVCIRFTKMIIAVLFLAYLSLLKNFWIALLIMRCPLDKKACRVYSFFSSLVWLADLYNLTTMSVFLAFPNLLKNF